MPKTQRAPAGPRALKSLPHRERSTAGPHSSIPPALSSGSLVPDVPMLSASSSTNQTLPSYDRHGDTARSGQSTSTFDFLTSASFDDLHSSIDSASSEFKLTQFPSPAGDGSILDRVEKKADQTSMSQSSAAPRGSGPSATASRTSRSGSILRRPSTSSRQPSVSSIVSSSSGALDGATSSAAVRPRRQSHYPPVSNTIAAAKPPRKSMGPGVGTESDTSAKNGHARRSSLIAEGGSSRGASRKSIDATAGVLPDLARATGTTRAAKAKSVQPTTRNGQPMLLGDVNSTPEQTRFSTLAPRSSPRTGGKPGTPSSSGSKRVSMMPGAHHSSHATGLGARTISPTDTKRMKRLSIMPQSNPSLTVEVPPPPPPLARDVRDESRSPSMIPRRTSATPSSSRTTPDMNNRKSYSSGLSATSATSYNTVRTSVGSIQPRLPAASVTSRLPALKHTSTLGSGQLDEDSDVPPVPAIPKVYESPKESPSDTYFMEKKKTSLNAVDSTSIHSNSTGSISMPVLPEPMKGPQRSAVRKSSYASAIATDDEKTTKSKRQLEPLRLPPLNIGPLNFPATSKVGSQTSSQRALSPPASRTLPKTPTTPMTASKSSFFAKSRYDDTMELPPLRSSSSIHGARRASPAPADDDSSDSSSSFLDANDKPNISPFLSSSLPKSGFELGHLTRSKTGGDYATLTGNNFFTENTKTKPSGPRDISKVKSAVNSPIPMPQPEPESETQEPRSPSAKVSLRRKLSLSWKRSSSKTGNVGPNDSADKNAIPASESMPPPKIPASATAGSLSNIKPPASVSNSIANGSNSGPRRRKTSGASLTGYTVRDRVKSETWGTHKESRESATVPTTRSLAQAGRPATAKSSTNALRTVGAWSNELDRDDLAAEEEMRKLGSRRKETEVAARTLDALKKRAAPKERVGPQEAIRIALLNIYERGEIIDYDDIYFCGTQNARKVVGDLHSDSPNFGYDDERGDYTIVPGDHLAYRYEIVDILGKGSFGQVVRCIDHKLGVLVAVKIIRNKKRFHQQALVEVNILQKLREWDPKNKHSMVNFTQSFYFRGHLCISTELLDMNLYEFIKGHSFRGFSLRIIRRFTKQILGSLVLLKQRKVIHCDLKPENILLRHPLHSEIKVIDFGSSCFEHEKVYTYIQSRFYRSPEVILGMTYGMPIDMWSMGCILAELYTGVPIFPGENEQEQLACIMEVFGPPEKHLIEKSTRKKLFFDSMGKPRLTVSPKGRRRRPSSKTLQQALKCDDEAFLDFIARCLRWDPDRRLRPEDAARHEFISGQKAPVLPKIPTREPSPVKRSNTMTMVRPLPDPPAIGAKTSMPTAMRTGSSPHKPVSGASRRVSGVTAATAASMSRRASAAGGSISSISSLPRVAGRGTSGKPDLAAAGATAAMSRRQ